MPRKKKVEDRTQEVLHSKVSITGEGEDAVVRDMMSDKFIHGKDSDVAEITIALAKLIRGQEMMSGEVAKIREQMHELDKRTEKRIEDWNKFVQETLRDTEKLLPKSDSDVARTVANHQRQLEKAQKKANLAGVRAKQNFEEQLKHMPLVEIVSPGIVVIEKVNGVQTAVIHDEVINIKHLSWRLPAGKVMKVPQLVAERYYQMKRTEEEYKEREKLLDATYGLQDRDKILPEWMKLNAKYGSRSQLDRAGSLAEPVTT